ncbi:unnamed protein product [Schistosoma mattheei]|uniref:Uncharacterized protein n=1 Tax=Schistosoma mattheei TaxID=31246 RepID=A0AA85B586_9TREM|nr:unnamed protein product [Schistosoma mattheei]
MGNQSLEIGITLLQLMPFYFNSNKNGLLSRSQDVWIYNEKSFERMLPLACQSLPLRLHQILLVYRLCFPDSGPLDQKNP